QIFTFGAMPFTGMSNEEAHKIICDSSKIEKLSKPDICPSSLYDLMKRFCFVNFSFLFYFFLNRCWMYDPSERPTFQEVLNQLEEIKQKEITSTTQEST